MRRQVAALGLVFLTAHLFFLPPTLEDVDSINFALGVRDFDVARHQPHPPGYPVFVALARASTAAADAAGAAAPFPQGLASLSALAGALLVPLLFAFFQRIEPRLAWWATIVTVCSSLFWFTALRPMSDMAGLAFAVGAQVLLLSVFLGVSTRDGRIPRIRTARQSGAEPADGTTGPRPFRVPAASPAARLAAGAAVAAVAAGVRSQTVMLTAPLLLAAFLWPGTGLTMRQRAAAFGAAIVGGLAWGVPLLVASGGLADYLAALGTQAGEDFGGVTMLWTTRQPRVALDALLNSFVWPWGAFLFGAAVAVMAIAGSLRAAVRAPRILIILAIAFGPYAVFHLLFHETHTLRYALPLIAPMALLALYAVAGLGSAAPAVAGTVIAVISLVVTVPATHAYARDGSPAFRLFVDAGSTGVPESYDGPPPAIGMHAVMRRVDDWAEWWQPAPRPRVLRAAHGQEWLALVDEWRAKPQSTVYFIADPRRTDLALFDPHARRLTASARWTFPEFPFLAGVRPGAADLYTMTPPGWMLGRGWSLTAEIGGVTAASGLGPHVQPGVAWVRARPEQSTLILGGRNLGEGDQTVRVTVAIESGEIDGWETGPGGFFRRVTIPEGALAGSGYLPLEVSAAAVHPPGRAVAVALEQFDLQPDGIVMAGFLDGWHEPEYQPATARSWRWMSERARLWVRPVGRDVTLTLTGESPLRYFDRAPVVRVVAAGVEVARFAPTEDFREEILISSRLLSASGGLVAIESDTWFTPAERHGSPDRRHLALRMYGVAVR